MLVPVPVVSVPMSNHGIAPFRLYETESVVCSSTLLVFFGSSCGFERFNGAKNALFSRAYSSTEWEHRCTDSNTLDYNVSLNSIPVTVFRIIVCVYRFKLQTNIRGFCQRFESVSRLAINVSTEAYIVIDQIAN